jgi:ribosome biogenesis GTPase
MNAASDLAGWGWDAGHADAFAKRADANHEAGRVLVEDRGSYLVGTALGEVRATLSGRFRFDAELDGGGSYPVVGDWLVLQPTGDPDQRLIHGLLPRRTAVIRRAPTDRRAPEQVLAANVDLVLIVTSLNHDLNPRRLERFLAVAWSSGAEPILVLNKADLAADVDHAAARIGALAGGVPVHAVSAVTGSGLDGLAARLVDGRTVVLMGSSGVGKSTLVNALAGTVVEATGDIRADDDRGRHTTSRRHLVRVPGRGLILDTPGLRELGLADDEGALDAAFADIDALAANCRFADCRHEREPDCAVRRAIAAGSLDPARLTSRRKLDREAARVERHDDPRARAERKRQQRLINATVDHHMRMKYGEDR